MDVEVKSRLFEEFDELKNRTEKLKTFILSDKYESLPEIDRTDLKIQLKQMEEYLSTLLRRVSRQCGDG